MSIKYKSKKEQDQFVSDVCQKYGLEFSKGEGVCGIPEQLNELEKALKEIGKYLKVSDRIHSLRINETLYHYFTYYYVQDNQKFPK